MRLKVSIDRVLWLQWKLTYCSIAIPKEHTIFRFTVPYPEDAKTATKNEDQEQLEEDDRPKPLVFELHGSQFENRPVDRANKKFKWKNVDYL